MDTRSSDDSPAPADPIDRLFEAASTVSEDGRPRFPSGSRGRSSGPAVRSVFVDATSYSHWKRANWPEDSRGSQLKLTEKLLDILSGRNLAKHVRAEFTEEDAFKI